MTFYITIILVVLLLSILDVKNRNHLVSDKDARIEVVNLQIILYEIEQGKLFMKINLIVFVINDNI